MEYFRIKNWKKYQHYNDRNPPWIKLHSALLSDYEFQLLPDVTKWHLVAIWLLASRSNTFHKDGDPLIPHDKNFIKQQSGIKVEIDYNLLISLEFLSCYQDASKQDASALLAPKTETEAYKEETEILIATTRENHSSQRPKVKRKRYSYPITWDETEGTFKGVTQEMVNRWKQAYPAVDIIRKLRELDEWLIANPAKRKYNYPSFIVNALKRSQERGGR